MSIKIESPKELRKICQRPPDALGLEAAVERNLARRLSIYITWVLLHTPITANQTTVLLTVIGLLGSLLLAFGEQWVSILGILLLFLHIILDYVDGEVARYRNTCSSSGKYLDLVAHKIVNPAALAGLSFGVYHNHSSPAVFVFGFLAAISRLLVRDVRRIALRVMGSAQANFDTLENIAAERRSPFFSRIRELGLHNLVYGTFGIQAAILVGAIFNRLDIVLVFYGATLPIFASSQVYWWFKVVKSSASIPDGKGTSQQSQDLELAS
jgi:phosphatidylglycerophosphate synthase